MESAINGVLSSQVAAAATPLMDNLLSGNFISSLAP